MTGFVTKSISRKRTLGSILKAARSKAGLTLEECEVQTRIRLKYLYALENGQYQSLPAEAYNIGFIRCYAEFLRLNPEKVMSLYRQERSEKRHSYDNNVNLAPGKVSDWQFLITPKVLGIVSAVLLFGGVITYIAIQLNQFTRPPEVNLSNFPSEFTSDKDKISLSGSTTEGSVVFMNNEPVLVDPSGEFEQEIQLSPGINQVIVSAESRAGKKSQKSVKILFNPNLAKASTSL